MTEEIIKLIDELAERFGVVIDWSSENVLPIVERLLEKFIVYSIFENCIWCIAGFALIMTFVPTKKIINKSRKKSEETGTHTVLFTNWGSVSMSGTGITIVVLCFIAVIAGVAIVGDSVTDLSKLIIIPELYVAEYFQLM